MSIIAALLVIGILGLDQGLKYWIIQSVPLGKVIGHSAILRLTHLQNYGAAWSIFSGRRWVFIVIAVTASMIFIWMMIHAIKKQQTWCTIGLALMLAGTLGNLIDRCRMGYVVDMFQLPWWPTFPIFNIADIALCIGVGIVLIVLFVSEDDE